MQLDAIACYRALRTRDPRFDGRFFIAVRTTGIYCRPICPAPPPKLINCTFMPSAAAAQSAGYRPCLRCRPESSPGTPAWQGSATSVSRALRLIDEGALDMGTVEALAGRLGMGERQLRRLFLRHVGASPKAVAQTRRLLFAKKLLSETRLPMHEVAFASGFASVRRFNDAMRATYRRAPSELRRQNVEPAPEAQGELSLELSYRPPLHWPTLLEYLALRATPGVEAVQDGSYLRTLAQGTYTGILRATPRPEHHRVEIRIQGAPNPPLLAISERVRRIFDLSADPEPIAEQLAHDSFLCRSVHDRPGVRIPGAWDRFELCVRAILGQQISVRGATTLTGRLADGFGRPLPESIQCPPLRTLFPTPDQLKDAPLERIGLPIARAETIRGLARALCDGRLTLEHADDLESAVQRLCALPGVGPWTAHYIALRALSEPDAFPSGDLALRKAFGLRDGAPLSARSLEARAAEWRPWRGYAALYAWTDPSFRHSPRTHPRTSPP